MSLVRSHLASRVVRLLAVLVGLLVVAPLGGAESPAGTRSVTVLVPGVTGVSLERPDGGLAPWGTGRALLWPRDRGYGVALPVVDGANPLAVPGRVLDEVRLTRWVRKPVYGPIFRRLEESGLSRGDLSDPGPRADLFGFAYDWRRSNVASARDLAEALEHLRIQRGQGTLEVRLICQSNGAHVCRWLAKYGTAGLDEAEAGVTRRPAGLRIERLVLVGASNGGSLRILREMNRGRRYVPVVGRPFRSEAFFTFRSLFEDLPAGDGRRFVDLDGRALDVDLWDPASWWTRDWSIFHPAVRGRLECRPRPDLFADGPARRRLLVTALEDARRFQRLLARDPEGYRPPALFRVENLSRPTPVRAVLTRKGPGRPWKTLFPGDRAVDRRPRLVARLLEPGDGHASATSQRRLSPAESRAVVDSAEVAGEHFEMILEQETLDALEHFLTVGLERPGISLRPEAAAERPAARRRPG